MFVWGSPWPFDRVRMGNALEQLRTENPKPKCDPNPWRLRQVHVSTASTVHNCLCAYFCWMTRHHIWTNLITKQCDITYKHNHIFEKDIYQSCPDYLLTCDWNSGVLVISDSTTPGLTIVIPISEPNSARSVSKKHVWAALLAYIYIYIGISA